MLISEASSQKRYIYIFWILNQDEKYNSNEVKRYGLKCFKYYFLLQNF